REHAELVHRAESILDRTHQPETRMCVAFEVEHAIDHVLEHTWTAYGTFLGAVTAQHQRRSSRFRETRQLRGALAYLRDAAGSRLQRFGINRLNRVDDRDIG